MHSHERLLAIVIITQYKHTLCHSQYSEESQVFWAPYVSLQESTAVQSTFF